MQNGGGSSFENSLAYLSDTYLAVRREHLFVNHSINNPGYPDNAGIPNEQSSSVTVSFGGVEF